MGLHCELSAIENQEKNRLIVTPGGRGLHALFPFRRFVTLRRLCVLTGEPKCQRGLEID